MAKIYYQEDCNMSLLEGKTIAIIGYGSQGHAHALNLKESGCNVIVGLYKGSKSWAKAEAQGFEVYTAAEAAKKADIIMILINDEKQAKMYKEDIAPNLEAGKYADVRPRLRHPLRTDRSSGRCGRNHDRTEGAGPYRTQRVSERQRNPMSGSRTAGCYRQGSGQGSGLCAGH